MGGEKFYREGSVEELAPAVVPAETYPFRMLRTGLKTS